MSAATLPDNTACPRCGGAFRCGAGDPSCACFGLQIGPALRAQLAADFRGCLCVACLAELQLQQQLQQLQQQEQKQQP